MADEEARPGKANMAPESRERDCGKQSEERVPKIKRATREQLTSNEATLSAIRASRNSCRKVRVRSAITKQKTLTGIAHRPPAVDKASCQMRLSGPRQSIHHVQCLLGVADSPKHLALSLVQALCEDRGRLLKCGIVSKQSSKDIHCSGDRRSSSTQGSAHGPTALRRGSLQVRSRLPVYEAQKDRYQGALVFSDQHGRAPWCGGGGPR